ncbi:MAG: ABC transporter ATP-binding protein [Desulfonauticus sp.]|nr:ABC transporter ATP-binding protein [Desulfonauticus sp.]
MTLLKVYNVSKSFGGLMAVNDVNFEVSEGTVMGLIGPNGAGKTTVFNLITGNYKPDSGEIIFSGKNITGLSPNKIVKLGIARTFQTIRLFQNRSVLENVLAGCHCRMRAGVLACMFQPGWQKQEEHQAVKNAFQELRFVGLEKEVNNQAKNLSYGNQRLLEIARALATRPKLLILDEPAGGMNEQETQALVRLIDQIKKRGITILLIEHDMSLVMKICEKIVVLEHGTKIAEGTAEQIKADPQVIEAYLGWEEDD